MPSKFKCDHCERTLTAYKGETGYVQFPDTKEKMCYDCLGKRDVNTMFRGERCIMYFHMGNASSREGVIEPAKVTNWPRTVVFTPFEYTVSHHNIAGTRVDAWWTGPDGARWHGYSIGDSELMRCNRRKRQRKEIYPLPENFYVKPYPYLGT